MKSADELDVFWTRGSPEQNEAERGKTLFFIISGIITAFALVAVGFEIAPVLLPKTSELQIQTNPKGAMVFVDGRIRGATPMKIVGLQPGSHQFRILKPGYFERQVQVQVHANSKEIVEWELFPAPHRKRSLELAFLPQPAGAGQLLRCHSQAG